MKLLCERCGYAMDAQTCPEDPDSMPEAGDFLVCLNCAAIYEFRNPDVHLLSDNELAQLPSAVLRQLAQIRLAVRCTVSEDLAFNQRLKERSAE